MMPCGKPGDHQSLSSPSPLDLHFNQKAGGGTREALRLVMSLFWTPGVFPLSGGYLRPRSADPDQGLTGEKDRRPELPTLTQTLHHHRVHHRGAPGGQTRSLSKGSDLFQPRAAALKPPLFVFATRIEIPGWRCDQLSESAHAGSDREIAESCQQVLPPYPHDSTHTLLYLQGCVVWEMTVCGIAPPHDGYQGRSPRSCHASATALFTQALGADRAASHKHRCQIVVRLLV